ncbi:ThiF family adenylyltransferase [bacterium]|nr:MAG: ThiF family adenylyltransferase [bacterium]
MLDTIRHIDVFSAAQFGDLRVDIIGAGATGSRIALELAKLGLSNIHVWDFDKIESHNVPNQVYGNNHIGEVKVEALKRIIEEQTGTVITCHEARVDGTQELGDVVYLLTDTMASRQEIWKNGLRYKPRTKLMIETRMGANSGRVYCVNPSSPKDVKGWEATLYSDDVAVVSACGTSITVGATAAMVTGYAVWQLIRWHKAETSLKENKEPDDRPENELIFSVQPAMVNTSDF